MSGRLVLIEPNRPNLDDPVTLEPLGGGRFRFVAKTGGAEVGEIVRFVEENGRVTRLVIGDGFFARVQNWRPVSAQDRQLDGRAPMFDSVTVPITLLNYSLKC